MSRIHSTSPGLSPDLLYLLTTAESSTQELLHLVRNVREIPKYQVEGYSTTKNILDITTDVFNIVAPLHYGIRFYKRNCSDMFESIQRNAKIHLEMD